MSKSTLEPMVQFFILSEVHGTARVNPKLSGCPWKLTLYSVSFLSERLCMV